MTKNIRDKSLEVTKALPNGAAAITSDGIDTGNSSQGDFVADCELEIQAPALVVGDLANGETMIYDIEHDDAADFSGVATLEAAVITQTGAGGVGAAAVTKRFKLTDGVKRYVRIKATNSGAGDASDKSLTAGLLF